MSRHLGPYRSRHLEHDLMPVVNLFWVWLFLQSDTKEVELTSQLW